MTRLEMEIKGDRLFDNRLGAFLNKEGNERFRNDIEAMEKELLADTAWNAYYNDMCDIEDISEAYYVIKAYYGNALAEKFLKEMVETGWYAFSGDEIIYTP